MDRLDFRQAAQAKTRARERAQKFFDVAMLWKELGRLSLPLPGLKGEPARRRWWLVKWPFGRGLNPAARVAARDAARNARKRAFRAAFWGDAQAR